MILKAKNISKAYEDKTILKDFQLCIKPKDFTVIYGASGCGKSTLLNILATLAKPDKGELYLEDINLLKSNPNQLAKIRNRYFGFVFQASNMLMHLNVSQNICLPFNYSSLYDINKQKEMLATQLEYFKIEHLCSSKISTLSGGEQQRVALARAIVMNPDIIFADEPTGNLDEENSTNIYKLFQEISMSGKSIVMVTHDPLAKKFATKVVKIG